MNVVGYLRSESGVGHAARAVVAGLDAAGVTLLPVHPHDLPPSRQGVPFLTVEPRAARFGVNLLCVTAFETPGFVAANSAEFFEGRRTIGFWWWEVSAFPDFMQRSFEYVDEVWVGSEHIAQALRPVAGEVPVNKVRVPVRRPPPTRTTREELNLPAGHLFVTVFGYYSSVVRKNPSGVIDAFTRAFAPGEGVELLVKCIDHEAHPEEHRQLETLAAGHPHVHLRAGYADEAEMSAVFQHADTVVSLHRAEGFGFTPAEAMALGRPVIATRYSGNLDYMTDANSYLVDATLCPIGTEGAPYPADGVWADPDIEHAARLMSHVVTHPTEAAMKGQRAARDMAAHYSAPVAGATMRARLDAIGASGLLAPRSRLRAWRLARVRARTGTSQPCVR